MIPLGINELHEGIFTFEMHGFHDMIQNPLIIYSQPLSNISLTILK